MSENDCGVVRELLPDFAANRAASEAAERIEAHLPGCAECRAELELVQMLVASRPAVPAGLAARVSAATRADRRPVRRPWWGISAAAVAALALGIGVSSNGTPPADVEITREVAAGLDEAELWPADDGLVAGGPALDGLSDEALMQLLDELSAEGGAA